jgi:hypothetical protein
MGLHSLLQLAAAAQLRPLLALCSPTERRSQPGHVPAPQWHSRPWRWCLLPTYSPIVRVKLSHVCSSSSSRGHTLLVCTVLASLRGAGVYVCCSASAVVETASMLSLLSTTHGDLGQRYRDAATEIAMLHTSSHP